jgi:hypothetical protein
MTEAITYTAIFAAVSGVVIFCIPVKKNDRNDTEKM